MRKVVDNWLKSDAIVAEKITTHTLQDQVCESNFDRKIFEKCGFKGIITDKCIH